MIGTRRLLVAVAGVVLVGACGTPEATSNEVDGWATGGFLMECTDRLAAGECAHIAGPAMQTISDEREIRTVKAYEEGPYFQDDGTAHLVDRGAGPVTVVVVTFEDGARRAAGVYCGIPVASAAMPPCSVIEPPFDD